MDCELIQAELLAYHFGTIADHGADDVRAELEGHLTGCPRCIADFIALKRAIETGAREAPSAGAKARLRAAVAAELRERARPPRRAWWERPLALSLAAAALSGGIASVRLLSAAPGTPPYGVVTHPE